MEDTTTTNEPTVEEEVVEEETPEEELTPETDWEAEAKKARAIAQRYRTKLIKATEKKKDESAVPAKQVSNSGELDATQLDYLDLKGISDSDEISVVQKVIQKTGVTVREALKDDYVVAKLKAIRDEKAVKDATPGTTKRAGPTQSNDVAAAIAKFEKSGELPDDFEMRTAVVNGLVSRSNVNSPTWHRK